MYQYQGRLVRALCVVYFYIHTYLSIPRYDARRYTEQKYHVILMYAKQGSNAFVTLRSRHGDERVQQSALPSTILARVCKPIFKPQPSHPLRMIRHG